MGFESISGQARHAQYKITDQPLTYSVTGSEHNMGGKNSVLRIRLILAERIGWKPGDCIDILWDKERQVGRLIKSEKKGYRLVVTSKRNGIASYRLGWTFFESYGFPEVKKQVSCEILEEFEDGLDFRIRVEDDDADDDERAYKSMPPPDDGGVGFNPRVTRPKGSMRR